MDKEEKKSAALDVVLFVTFQTARNDHVSTFAFYALGDVEKSDGREDGFARGAAWAALSGVVGAAG